MSQLSSRLKALRARVSDFGGRNALMYTVTAMLSRAATLLLAPLYTRTLSTDEYGDLALAQTLIATLPTFVSLGLLSAVSRFYFEGKTTADGLARAGSVARWLLVLAGSQAVIAQLVLFVLPLPEAGLTSFRTLSCVVWGATGTLFLGIPLGVLRSAQRAALASALQLADFAIALTSAIVLVVVLGRGLNGAVEALGLAGAFTAALGAIFALRVLPGTLDRTVFREAVAFSLPYVPHFAANQLLLISDRWLLKLFGFDSDLGVYSVASQLAAPVLLVVTSWNEAASPRLGEKYRADGVAGLKAAESTLVRSYIFLAGGAAAALLVGSPLIFLVLGAKFANAFFLVPGFCLVIVLESAYYPYSNVLFFMKHTRLLPRITVLAGVFNVLANVALIPMWGMYGAIVSRGVASLARSLLAAVWARREMARS